MPNFINNTHQPNQNVLNPKRPNGSQLHIDFTIYSNWNKSCKIRKYKFTNYYENNEHVNKTLSFILFKLFPHIQDNISNIISGQESHCHIVDEEDKLEVIWDIIGNIYPQNKISQEAEIYQMGTTGATRVFGSLINTEQQYIFYPLFIDCNHLVYPSTKHNQKDFKKFKAEIK